MAGTSNQLPSVLVAPVRGVLVRRLLRPSVAAAVIVACVCCVGEALGCPNCKDAVNTADPEGLNLARGYFYSILIMLAMPATLIGSFAIYVWREVQRQKRAGSSAVGEAVMQPTALPLAPPHP